MIIVKEILVKLRVDTVDSESCITPISHSVLKMFYSMLLIIIECYYDASHTSYVIIFASLLCIKIQSSHFDNFFSWKLNSQIFLNPQDNNTTFWLLLNFSKNWHFVSQHEHFRSMLLELLSWKCYLIITIF